MYLSDVDIKREIQAGNIAWNNYCDANISNSSIDLCLNRGFSKAKSSEDWAICLPDENGKISVVGTDKQSLIDEFWEDDGLLLYPGDFVLGHTLDVIGSRSPNILAQLSDKSTLARLGLGTFFGAGYIDPGNVLSITLELKNNGKRPILLRAGQHICQIRFAYLNSPCSKLYDGKYLGATTVQSAC